MKTVKTITSFFMVATLILTLLGIVVAIPNFIILIACVLTTLGFFILYLKGTEKIDISTIIVWNLLTLFGYFLLLKNMKKIKI